MFYSWRAAVGSSRQHLLCWNRGADSALQTESAQSGRGQDHGIVLTLIKFAQPRINIAAQFFHD